MGSRSPRTRLLLWGLIVPIVALASAACGGSDADDTPRPQPSAREDAGGDGQVETCGTQAQLYLVRGEQLGVAHHVVEYESDDCGGTEPMLEAAMRQLLVAPLPADRTAGLATTIPPGTELLDLDIEDDLATVDLSRSFETGGGSLSMTVRVAQVVATLTAITGVDRVAFRLDGDPVRSIGGEGVLVDPPRTMADIEATLPAILLEDPAPGDCLTDSWAGEPGTLHVAGSANVFEGVLFAELRSGSRVLETERVMAESGTGTRGDFEASIPIGSATSAGDVTVTAYSRSPRDGARENDVRVAVDSSC